MENKLDHVIKRNGSKPAFSFSSIEKRIMKLCKIEPPLENISISLIIQKIAPKLYNYIKTSDIDLESAQEANSMALIHPDYAQLAGRILASNNAKNLNGYTLLKCADELYHNFIYQSILDADGRELNEPIDCPIVSEKYYKFVERNQNELNRIIVPERDNLIDYFGHKTLERSYLLRKDGKCCETVQFMWMRVAITVSCGQNIKETYDALSLKKYAHATPTNFNSGSPIPQLSSCYLLGCHDSIDGIEKCHHDCASISRFAGGIAVHYTKVRGKDAPIRSNNGRSSGIIPFLIGMNTLAKAVNQGSKRNGSIAIYLEVEHPDVLDFISLRRPRGDESMRARDLFIALWVCDLFMERVEKDEMWSLMDPNETKWKDNNGKIKYLSDVYGKEYEKRYLLLEEKKKFVKQVKARDLWREILLSQRESGFPYICYKDTANRLSNQKNIGIIASSNLCTEIFLHSSDTEYAVCNLANMCLQNFVSTDRKFDFIDFATVVRLAIRNLNNVIDLNYYPVPETKLSNFRHRPIGLGVQGQADAFHKMKIAYAGEDGRQMNKLIYETMYYAALCESCELARQKYLEYRKECKNSGFVDVITGYENQNSHIVAITKRYENVEDIPTTSGAYTSFKGSPISKGKFHTDLWIEDHEYRNKRFVEIAQFHDEKVKRLEYELTKNPDNAEVISQIKWHKTCYEANMGSIKTPKHEDVYSKMWDWESLREKVKIFGVRNSQLIALMPTSSMSQILGSNECFEPYTTNYYTRSTLAGEFPIVNKYLALELLEQKKWNEEITTRLKVDNGSIANIADIDNDIKFRYQTVWEMDPAANLRLAYDRSAYVDQGQSFNIYVENPDDEHLSELHFTTWRAGFKTGMYYLRRRPAVDPQKLSVSIKDIKKYESKVVELTLNEACLSCQ